MPRGLYSDCAMASDPVTTTVTELPESRVRVEAEVPARWKWSQLVSRFKRARTRR